MGEEGWFKGRHPVTTGSPTRRKGRLHCSGRNPRRHRPDTWLYRSRTAGGANPRLPILKRPSVAYFCGRKVAFYHQGVHQKVGFLGPWWRAWGFLIHEVKGTVGRRGGVRSLKGTVGRMEFLVFEVRGRPGFFGLWNKGTVGRRRGFGPWGYKIG